MTECTIQPNGIMAALGGLLVTPAGTTRLSFVL
jgi:hypothetical protein